MAEMFEHRLLTVRLTPADIGLELHPVFDCINDETCLCTEGCSQSCECTHCDTPTCKGADSIGGFLPTREGDLEMVLDLEKLRDIMQKVERWEGRPGKE
jgi:hypothetical protein